MDEIGWTLTRIKIIEFAVKSSKPFPNFILNSAELKQLHMMRGKARAPPAVQTETRQRMALASFTTVTLDSVACRHVDKGQTVLAALFSEVQTAEVCRECIVSTIEREGQFTPFKTTNRHQIL